MDSRFKSPANKNNYLLVRFLEFICPLRDMNLSSVLSYRQLRRLSGTVKFRITSVLAIAVVLNKEMAETPALCQKFVIFLQPASIVSIQIGYNLARKDAFQLSLEVIPH